jgi:ribosomal protein L7/L12
MSDVYNGNRSHYESIRQEILAFLHLDSEPAKSVQGDDQFGGVDDEASVVSLLKQGRRIDAIELVRSTQKLGLTEATQRVAQILERMKTTQ